MKDKKVDFLVKLKEVLFNRRKFDYSSSDYIYEIFWWCKCNRNTSKQSKLVYRNQIYKNGIKRFTYETDLVEVIKSIRMLKTLSKILLSKNQRCLLGLEDSNLLTNQKCKSIETHEIIPVQNINTAFHETIFGRRKSVLSPLSTPYIIETPLDHDHLPSYLSKEVDPEFRFKIDNLISNFADEKVTAHNMKILKLAYGFIEEDESQAQNDLLNSPVLITEESSNSLFKSRSRERHL